MKKKNQTILKATATVIMIILANFIQIPYLTFGQVEIVDFRCDAEVIGFKQYKADVGQEINFIYDAEFYETVAVFLGDGTYLDYIEDSTFSHIYDVEGIYNITLWVIGSGPPDSEWMIIEVENDAPEFDIGYTSVEYHEATYHFEDSDLSETPKDWSVYNNEDDFFLDGSTVIFPGKTIDGDINRLRFEDQQSWKIESEWTGGNYRYVQMFLHFDQYENHIFSPGKYQLFFSTNDSIALLGYNPDLNQNEILFHGNYSNGNIITITYPDSLELFASFYIESFLQHKDVIEIDWFKLVKVEKGVEIVEDEHDHAKIVKLNFGAPFQYCGMQQSYTSQTYGTIEFWYRTEDTNLGGKMIYGPNELGIVQKDNQWFISIDNALTPVTSPDSPPLNNTWYHLRIDFVFSGPDYMQLSERRWMVYIDGDAIPTNPTLPFGLTKADNFLVESNGTIFIDAIGYSWDPDYYVGQNVHTSYPDILYEDLEITFSAINLIESDIDKTGFSYESDDIVGNNFTYIWDFGDGNFSNEENPTHQFANTGEFPVRLTMIDDQGAMSTKVKNFIIENKEPEVEIVHGLNFDATYDFKYGVSDKPPSEWETHGNINIIDFKDEFSKVVEIDNTEGGYGSIRIPEPEVGYNGTIEFWIYFTDIAEDQFFFWIDKLDPNDDNPFALKNSTRFGYLDGKWMYYYTYKGPSNIDKFAYSEMTELSAPNSNEWTHIRFDYCWSDNLNYQGLSDKQWRIYVNGLASNIYSGVGNRFTRKGLDAKAGSHIYLESVGFTTDDDYKLGDNNPERKESFYGTWDFRFYPSGPIPYDETLQSTVLGPWVFGSYNFEQIANSCSANIVPELDNHHKVLELQDNNPDDLVFASLIDLAESAYGTIEFWLRTTDTSQGLVMALGYEIFSSGIWLGEDGKWWYKNGDNYLEISDVPKMLNNTWHHIRVDFDCRSSGGYLGLGHDQFHFWVDGNYSYTGPYAFDSDVSNFGWNIWSTIHESSGYSIYLDAIGNSWDPAYNIGDNLGTREAIYSDSEIIFSADSDDTPTDRDNLRYLWNFGDNQTGFGQTVLHSYSRAGKYKVKLIVLDDNGQFDIAEDYIWIDNVYPSTDIVEIKYGSTTYDFSSDNIGDFPNGWHRSDLEEILGNFTEVVSDIDIFSNVVLIGNGTGSGGIWTSDLTGLPFNQTLPGELSLINGTIEFWVYSTDSLKSQLYISFFEDSYLDGVFIEFVNGTWMHNGEEIIFENLWAMEDNTWAHLRIDFCCDTSSYMGLANDTFIMYADGYASQTLDMVHNNHADISNLTCFGVFTRMEENEITQVYVDNFGFSWDPEYDIGDNRFEYIQYQFNEGETIILDCMSYDTYTDYQRLIYNWGNLYHNIGEWKDKGWHYSYTFEDNDDGDELEGYPIILFVGDPLYMWDIDSYYIEVNNVLPTLNIHSTEVKTNISLSINNIGTEAANFTILVSSPHYNQTIFDAEYPANYPDNLIYYNFTIVSLDVSKDWKIIVNQTGREGGTHEVTLMFNYDNGYQHSSFNSFDGTDDIWAIDLNEMWIDSLNYIPEVPLTFEATISDPSDDKVDLAIDYLIKVIYEVDPSTPYNLYASTISHEPSDIRWEMQIDGDPSNTYATSEFRYTVPNDWDSYLRSGTFPVSYHFDFVADMTDIDIYDLIDGLFISEGINVIGHVQTNHFIEANYSEVQPASTLQKFNIGFNISDTFEFENLAPSIRIQVPFNITEDQTITYLADIDDINGDNATVQISFGINDGNGLFFQNATYLGNNLFGVNYTYQNQGKYLVNVLASDGTNHSKALHLIEVINSVPYAKIITELNVTAEDQFMEFKADIYDTQSDIDSIRFFWDFGDGVYSAERTPSHAFFQAGNYTVKLNVRDDNGATYTALYNITVLDLPPEILGPFTFKGFEGQTIVLDVDAVDSVSDFNMNYTWNIYKAEKIFNATYNFMGIDQGSVPGTPFEFSSVADVQYRVVDEIAGHTKVIEMQDANDLLDGSWSLRYGDTTSINGSIEFWLRSTYISAEGTNFAINLKQYGTGMIPIYIMDNGTFMYRSIFTDNTSIIPGLPRLTSNIWHHIRIDYECSSGSYSSLGENEWRIIVDGVSSPILALQFDTVPPNNDASYLDSIQISSGSPNNMSIYCDAIGYFDGSSQYQLGTNHDSIFHEYGYVTTLYGQKPSLALEAGTYLIDLLVENNLSSQTEISLEVEAVAPILAVPNKRYYGAPGYIDITANAWDSIIDPTNLEFEWLINNKRVLMESGTLSSTISIFCNQTGDIKGHVSVRDSADLFDSSDFFIKVFLDSNGDGNSNEWEKLHNITSPDMDFDGLPNFYENRTTGTDFLKWDTDDDLLSDGYSSDSLSGELTIGTDPLNNDTDADFLEDGFEWFGWNHTLFTESEQRIVHYRSNPLRPDTDFDTLTDYDEYIYKTNPFKPDTDNDRLLDSFEIFDYGSDPTNPDTDGDGIIDGIEYEIGTHYDVDDTDGDGISDGSEYYGWAFITDPLTTDSDHDFLNDASETFLVEYEINGRKNLENPVSLYFWQRNIERAESASISFLLTYGETTLPEQLSDFRIQIFKLGSKVILYDNIFTTDDEQRYFSDNIDIKDTIEQSGNRYSGFYILKVRYLNADHGELSLENYGISVSRYLDPNDDDFDDDTLMDGVESQLIVEGINQLEFEDFVNITADTNHTTYDSYEIEIDDLGVIDDADIYFTIKSNQTLTGGGSVAVKVVQKELDNRVEDLTLEFPMNNSFSSSEVFLQNYHFKPNGNAPYNLYGKYHIVIDIYDTSTTDLFILTNITVDIDGYRAATLSDTEAWLTKPDQKDSDRDGWSDSYEINRNEPTNPLAWDTDGDGVKDSKDVDPLYDIILRVYFDEGHVGDLPKWYVRIENKPTLQMTVSYDFHGDYIAYATRHSRASKGVEYAGSVFKKKYYGTAVFNRRHYINIDDDDRTFKLRFKLWDEGLGGTDALWDTPKMSRSYTHDLRDYRRGEKYTSGRKSSGDNWIKYEVTTLGLSRVNTITIYNNESLFNGHYNQRDRMHVFQLEVTGSTAGTPFDPGLNVIVIPNSIFANTQLNSIIQNETALANSLLVRGEFMAMDREDLPDSASVSVETLFAITVTVGEAQQILDWAMIGIVNVTSGELGIVNQYADGYRAEMMNLHPDVLSVIEINNPYRDSIRGSMPKDAGEWWADLAAKIVKAFVDFVTAIIEIIVNIIKAIVEAILLLVELLVKLALLIYIYLMWALTLALVVLTIIILAPIFLILSFFLDIEIDLGIDHLTVDGDIEFSLGYELGLEYDDFLGLDIPTIEVNFNCPFIGFDILFSHYTLEFEFTHFLEETTSETSNNKPKTSFTEDESLWDSFAKFFWILKGLGIGMSIMGASFVIGTGIVVGSGGSIKEVIFALAGMAIALAGLFASSWPEASKDGYLKQLILGLGLGFIISGFAALIAMIESRNYGYNRDPVKWSRRWDFKKKLKKIDWIFKIMKGYFFVDNKFLEFSELEQEKFVIQCSVYLISGSISITAGSLGTTLIWDPGSRKATQLILALISFSLGAVCLIAAFTPDE